MALEQRFKRVTRVTAARHVFADLDVLALTVHTMDGDFDIYLDTERGGLHGLEDLGRPGDAETQRRAAQYKAEALDAERRLDAALEKIQGLEEDLAWANRHAKNQVDSANHLFASLNHQASKIEDLQSRNDRQAKLIAEHRRRGGQ